MDTVTKKPSTKEALQFIFSRPKTKAAITAWSIAPIAAYLVHGDYFATGFYFLAIYVSLQTLLFKVLNIKESSHVTQEMLDDQDISAADLDKFSNVYFWKDVTVLILAGIGIIYAGFNTAAFININIFYFASLIGFISFYVPSSFKKPIYIRNRLVKNSGPEMCLEPGSSSIDMGIYTYHQSQGETVIQTMSGPSGVSWR